jgi:hypothetical protein
MIVDWMAAQRKAAQTGRWTGPCLPRKTAAAYVPSLVTIRARQVLLATWIKGKAARFFCLRQRNAEGLRELIVFQILENRGAGLPRFRVVARQINLGGQLLTKNRRRKNKIQFRYVQALLGETTHCLKFSDLWRPKKLIVGHGFGPGNEIVFHPVHVLVQDRCCVRCRSHIPAAIGSREKWQKA